jgi:fumarate hydratase class II
MAASLTRADTFAALDDCFTTDLAALIGGEPPRNPTPNQFIDLVEQVRDVLATSSLGNLQDASEDLDSAVDSLTDALTSPDGDQRSLLAAARTHLRDAIETAN